MIVLPDSSPARYPFGSTAHHLRVQSQHDFASFPAGDLVNARPRKARLLARPIHVSDSTNNSTNRTTAIEYLLNNPRIFLDMNNGEKSNPLVAPLVRKFLESKNYNLAVAEELLQERILVHLMQGMLLKASTKWMKNGSMDWDLFQAEYQLYNTFTDREPLDKVAVHSYSGTRAENKRIDSAIRNSVIRSAEENQGFTERECNGFGAATCFEKSSVSQMWGSILKHEREMLRDTKIIVIGAGPGGLMTTRMLVEIGFKTENITVIDKSGKYGGIWQYRGVKDAYMNNPRRVNFLGKILEPAPGPGQRIVDFLGEIETGFYQALPVPIKAEVERVEPSDYAHQVYIRAADGKQQVLQAPLVVNAIGIGQPKQLRPGDMEKSSRLTERGKEIRWQMVFNKRSAELLRNKQVVIMGLGNSAIEVVRQIQELNDQGYNIGYKILTHNPALALSNPEIPISYGGRTTKFYRDLGETILTKISGDLEYTRKAFERAKQEGCIYTDVDLAKTQRINDETLRICFTDSTHMDLPCNKVFNLIGYKHPKEIFSKMGISVDEEGCPYYDYDGEFQRPLNDQDKGRTYKGYCGIGAVLANPDDQNAFVMPGMMHRMPWLMFNLLMRAFEHNRFKQTA